MKLCVSMVRTLLLVYLLVAVVYSMLVMSMTGEFIVPEWLGSVAVFLVCSLVASYERFSMDYRSS